MQCRIKMLYGFSAGGRRNVYVSLDKADVFVWDSYPAFFDFLNRFLQ